MQKGKLTRKSIITFNGQSKSITEWSLELGVQDGTIVARLKRGWTIEESFSIKTNQKVDVISAIKKYDFDNPTYVTPITPPVNSHPNTRHGFCPRRNKTKRRKISEYSTWQGIKNRCFNPNMKGYAGYGGKGIKICERWGSKNGFVAFLNDLGMKPSPKHSIDRIDPSGHYSCGKCQECLTNGWGSNCRWASKEVQDNNKKESRFITYKGYTFTVALWEHILGFNTDTIRQRLDDGWPIEKALETKPRARNVPQNRIKCKS